jgi:putative hydrolase of the HAD superfamily
MIRAVLWDFGGVLTTSPFDAFNRYEAERGLPRDFIRTVNATNAEHNAWARFESSLIGPDEFDSHFEAESRALGHAVRGRDVMELLSGDLRPRMVAALRACKARYKVGCLTNNVKSARTAAVAAIDTRAGAVQAVMELFDVVVESSKEGIRKPNPAFYLRACELLDVRPEESVFLDDLGINLKPAKALGMTTIKVVSEDQALRALADVVDLR